MGKAIEIRNPLVAPPSRDVPDNLIATTLPKATEKPSRRVSFSNKRSVRRYKKNYNESDYNKIWYSRCEINAINEENSKALKKESKKAGRDRRSRHFIDTDEWSWRGFEYAIHKYGKQGVKTDHTDTVLRFQNKMQRKRSRASALADHTRNSSVSNGSTLRARSNAIRDELEVTRIRKESKGPRRTKTF